MAAVMKAVLAFTLAWTDLALGNAAVASRGKQ